MCLPWFLRQISPQIQILFLRSLHFSLCALTFLCQLYLPLAWHLLNTWPNLTIMWVSLENWVCFVLFYSDFISYCILYGYFNFFFFLNVLQTFTSPSGFSSEYFILISGYWMLRLTLLLCSAQRHCAWMSSYVSAICFSASFRIRISIQLSFEVM